MSLEPPLKSSYGETFPSVNTQGTGGVGAFDGAGWHGSTHLMGAAGGCGGWAGGPPPGSAPANGQ